ncbi:hypothetical protein ACEPPN_015390 [Leptodophora sp. 'Broadleaf-Isolate-01']
MESTTKRKLKQQLATDGKKARTRTVIGAKTTSVAAAATVTTAPAHREEGEDGDEIEDEEDSGNYPVKFIVATEFRRLTAGADLTLAHLVQWDIKGYEVADRMDWVDAAATSPGIPQRPINSEQATQDDKEYRVVRVWATRKTGKSAECLVEWDGYPNIDDLTWERRSKVMRINRKAFEYYEEAKRPKSQKRSTADKTPTNIKINDNVGEDAEENGELDSGLSSDSNHENLIDQGANADVEGV